MARLYFHNISHQQVSLVTVKDEPHPQDGTRTCIYMEQGSKEKKTCSEEHFFNFFVPVDKTPWFDPHKNKQVVEATAEEKVAPWPANQLRERRLRGEFNEGDYTDDFLPDIDVGDKEKVVKDDPYRREQM